MKLKAIYLNLLWVFCTVCGLQAQQAVREVIDDECLLVAFRTKGAPQATTPNMAFFDIPKFFPIGIPRLHTITASLSKENMVDRQGYLNNNKHYIFFVSPEDLKDFYETEGLDAEIDSISTFDSGAAFKNFSDSLVRISKNVFYLKQEDHAVEFVVVRAKWLRYKVRKKPKMLLPVLRRELVQPFYELYFLKQVYEIYSLGDIADPHVVVYPK